MSLQSIHLEAMKSPNRSPKHSPRACSPRCLSRPICPVPPILDFTEDSDGDDAERSVEADISQIRKFQKQILMKISSHDHIANMLLKQQRKIEALLEDRQLDDLISTPTASPSPEKEIAIEIPRTPRDESIEQLLGGLFGDDQKEKEKEKEKAKEMFGGQTAVRKVDSPTFSTKEAKNTAEIKERHSKRSTYHGGFEHSVYKVGSGMLEVEDAFRDSQGSLRSTQKKHSHPSHSCFHHVVHHPAFEYFSAFVIILHAFFIGLYVEYLASHGDTVPTWLKTANLVLVFVFIGEVAVKMEGERWGYFVGKEKLWNLFDVVLVAVVIVELSIAFFLFEKEHKKQMKSLLKLGEMARTARVLRIFRFLRFSPTLSVILSKVLHSVKPLCWVMVLVSMLLYVVAVSVTQGTVEFLDGRQHETTLDDGTLEGGLYQRFGSVPKSAGTVFEAIAGGLLWGPIFDDLVDMNRVYAYLFFSFIALAIFALANIVTGIFVDASLQSGRHERDLMQEQESRNMREQALNLCEVFGELDSTGTGQILLSQFSESLQDPRVRDYLTALKIDTSNAKHLFNLLDEDGSGEILIDEFINGCMKLKGEAKSFDVHTLLHEVRKMRRWMQNNAEHTHHQLSKLMAHNFPDEVQHKMLSGPPQRSKSSDTNFKFRDEDG